MATKKNTVKGMSKAELELKLEQDGVIKKPTTAKKTTTKTSAAKKPATKTSTATKPKADAATKEAPKAEAKKPAPKKAETKPTEKSLKKVAAKKPAPKKSAEKAPAQAKHPSRDKIFPKEFNFGELTLTRLDVKNFDEAVEAFKSTEESEDSVLFLCTYWPKSTLLDYEGNCLPRYRMVPPTKGFEHDLDVSQVSYLQERKDLGISRFVCFSSITSSTTAVYKSQMESRIKEGYFIAFDVECEFYMGTADEEAE